MLQDEYEILVSGKITKLVGEGAPGIYYFWRRVTPGASRRRPDRFRLVVEL